jgi:hypothetical protein
MLSVVVADLAELVQDAALLGLGAIFIAQTPAARYCLLA